MPIVKTLTLRARWIAETVLRVKRTELFLIAVVVGLLGGCATHREALCELPYWQVVVTDVEGCWISEYIAEGDVTPICNGYCFRAVQRRTFRPWILTYKYPLGRPVKVQAPNIIITPTCKPLWLKITDLYTPPPNQCRPKAVGVYGRQNCR